MKRSGRHYKSIRFVDICLTFIVLTVTTIILSDWENITPFLTSLFWAQNQFIKPSPLSSKPQGLYIYNLYPLITYIHIYSAYTL